MTKSEKIKQFVAEVITNLAKLLKLFHRNKNTNSLGSVNVCGSKPTQ